MISGAPGVQMQAVPDDLLSIEDNRNGNDDNIRSRDYHR